MNKRVIVDVDETADEEMLLGSTGSTAYYLQSNFSTLSV